MHYVRLISLSATAAIALAGCSGNSSTSFQESRAEKVSGFAGAANMATTTIQAVSITNQGQPETGLTDDNKEALVGRVTTTAPNGYFEVVIEGDKIGAPTVVIASSPTGNSKIRCEKVAGCEETAYLGNIPLEKGFEYRSLVTDIAANMVVNVNWLTHIANAYAYTSYIDTTNDGVNNPDTAKPGIYTRYTIDVANKRISQLLGVADITSVRPIAPSQLAVPLDTPLLLQQQGIRYGAMLASLQYIKPDGTSYVEFLNHIIRSFNANKGQMLLRAPDDGSEISVDEIWRGAELALRENIAYLRGRNLQVPSVADAVLADIVAARAVIEQADEGVYTSHPVPTLNASAQSEIDSIANAKWFIDDLNKRLINFDGSDPSTCTGSDSDAADCLPSFIDFEYRRHMERYWDDLDQALNLAGPDLMAGFRTVRDAVDYYASALNGSPDPSNPLADSGRVTIEEIELPDNGGIADDTNDDGNPGPSKKLKLVSGSDDVLYLSFKKDEDTPRKPPQGKSYLFRIYIEGKLTENSRSFSFDVGSDSTGQLVKPYLELEYENALATPVPFAVAEPLTLKLVWPSVRVQSSGVERSYDLTQLFEAELVGITDPIIESSEMRYNLKRISYRGLAEGDIINPGADEEIRDKTEGILTLNSAEWSNYYPQNKWPQLEEFLQVRPGFDVVSEEDSVFRYFVGNEVVDSQSVDYLDLQLLNGDGSVASGTRYRLHLVADEANQFDIEACSLDISAPDTPVVNVCSQPVRRLQALPAGQQSIQIEQLAQKLLPEIYSINGRGSFLPKFAMNAGDAVDTLTRSQWMLLPGRVINISEGLFRYRVGNEDFDDADYSGNISYVDFVVLTDNDNVSIGYRNRLIPMVDQSDQFYLQRCAINVDENGNGTVVTTGVGDDEKETCDEKTAVSGEPNISSLALALQRNTYTVPSRGLYQVRLPVAPVVSLNEETQEYVEVIEPLPLDESNAVTLNGALVSQIRYGVDSLSLRLAAETYKRDTGQEEESVGPLIADIKAKVLADNLYDFAITFGYRYQYLVDVVPTGTDAQSLFVAYRAGFGSGNDLSIEEIGTLLIFRGGVVLAGKDAAESVGLFATSKVDYERTQATTDVKACGAANRDQGVIRCDALAYIGFKGALLGVVREERDDVYVARFINGDFVILGK